MSQNKKRKLVPTTLEKATPLPKGPFDDPETEPKTSILNGPPEFLDAIKPIGQRKQEEQEQRLEEAMAARSKARSDRLWFYLGVFGTIVVLFMGVRYFRTKPDTKHIIETANNVVSLVPK